MALVKMQVYSMWCCVSGWADVGFWRI